MKAYTIGVDFGTLSGRCVLVDCADGREVAESTYAYPHGVMDEALPCGKKLPRQFALQHPQDYLDTLRHTVPDVIKKSGIAPEQVKGIGIDFTTCTLLPVDEKGEPLCFRTEYKENPYAYVKLWKHHAAQPQADAINALAEQRKEPWLEVYGGRISSEWALPKIMETLQKAPEVFEKAAQFTEAADWVARMITGTEGHNVCMAGYKALWWNNSYPSNDFLKALDPRLDGLVGTKLSEKVTPSTGSAGLLDDRGAEITGLPSGIPVAVPIGDAHAAMAALNITDAGELMLIVGTSSCHIIHSKTDKPIRGICGYVKDGVMPGVYTYEAGQAGVGDIFDWYVKNNVPAAYTQEAEDRGMRIHALLREKAKKLAVGESGLIALDWLNGNRSVLDDSELTGLMMGMTLRTKPEEIYRAWIESTAYGTRMIIENLEANGVAVDRVKVAGGIALKDDMMMQIYADVTGRQLDISESTQAGALGSAIYAAAAGGVYPDIRQAAEAMSAGFVKTYLPNEDNHQAYSRLYEIYRQLHDAFGREENSPMKQLLALHK